MMENMNITIGKSYTTRNTNEIVVIIEEITNGRDKGRFKGFYHTGGWSIWNTDGTLWSDPSDWDLIREYQTGTT